MLGIRSHSSPVERAPHACTSAPIWDAFAMPSGRLVKGQLSSRVASCKGEAVPPDQTPLRVSSHRADASWGHRGAPAPTQDTPCRGSHAPVFWLSWYRKHLRRSGLSLNVSCRRDPDFFSFCISHRPGDTEPSPNQTHETKQK